MSDKELFQSEMIGNTIIIVPTRNMGEFEMAEMEADPMSAFQQLAELTDGHNVVVDLSQTDYFGSSTIGLFNRLVSHVREQSRKVAFCNLSSHEQEVVQITRVSDFWDVKESREEAIRFVSMPDDSQRDGNG